MSRFWRLSALLLLCGLVQAAKAPQEHNELPPPFNLQAVTVDNSIALTWVWQGLEAMPAFREFVYEVKRSAGKIFSVKETTYKDERLPVGDYTYVVRAKGVPKDKKLGIWISVWSEPVSGKIRSVCAGSPSIELTVEPTQSRVTKVPSIRFRLRGLVKNDPSCTLQAVRYHLDSGTGIVHSGALKLDAQNRFDAYVDAIGPEDEIPEGRISFAVSATAQNEAGITTASPTSIDVELQNKFAPR